MAGVIALCVCAAVPVRMQVSRFLEQIPVIENCLKMGRM